MRLSTIFISAGLSSRMNGRNKLLEEIREGQTLVLHTFSEVEASDTDEVIVVTGRDGDKINSEVRRVQNSKFKVIFNSEFDKGMTTSIQAGFNAIDEEVDAVMICLSDMPELKPQHYSDLINSFKAHGGRDKIMAPFKASQKGNPVIFGAAYFQEILDHKDMDGCSDIVKNHQDKLIRFETTSEAYFYDIDTPEALEAYRNRVK